MKLSHGISAMALSIAGAVGTQVNAAATDANTLIVTASNTATNELLIYSPTGALLKQISTQGEGGASGNAGGIAQDHNRLAVVNFGSNNVTVFTRDPDGTMLRFEKLIEVSAAPVSVAFGHDHLYILTTADVESHRIDLSGVTANADGEAGLLVADGSAAQVGVLPAQLIFTEKSNAIETATLDDQGAIAGKATLVANIPANVNEPLGLITRGKDAYVTIAKVNEVTLVRNDEVLTVGSTGSQNAPCWLAFDGPFLFSSNTGSKTISRFAVYGQNIILDAPVTATLNGNSTDIAQRNGLLSVVDNNGTVSHLSMFHVDEDGNLSLQGLATINSPATNGVVIFSQNERFEHN
jgi:6-phosphogluconolactonase (cycloisomerase 2 family)